MVILAAGMDARAYRLPWQPGVNVYEVDQPRVTAIKDERLAGEQPRCQRVAVGIDLADDWPKALRSQGFSSSAPAVWLVEVCCSTSGIGCRRLVRQNRRVVRAGFAGAL